MKITADTDRCIGSGMCVTIEPAVFDQGDDDGIVTLLDESPAEPSRDVVERAVESCPARALHVADDI